jgi:hypothetical protein
MRRRDFIACSIAGSSLLTLGVGSMLAHRAIDPRPPPPLLLLRTAGNQPVIDGVRQIFTPASRGRLTEVMLDCQTMFDSRALVDIVSCYAGCRVIAVLDDSTDILVSEVLRSMQTDVLMTGHHVGGSEPRSASRHTLWLAESVLNRSTSSPAGPDPADPAFAREMSVSQEPWLYDVGKLLGLVAAGQSLPSQVIGLSGDPGAGVERPAVRVSSMVAALRAPITGSEA